LVVLIPKNKNRLGIVFQDVDEYLGMYYTVLVDSFKSFYYAGVSKMARGKSNGPSQFEHVLNVLCMNPESRDTGRQVTVDEIGFFLGDKVKMSRMSVYLWEIKSRGVVVKSIRGSGRKVAAYQIMNVQTAQDLLSKKTVFTPVASAPEAVVETVEEEMADAV